MLIGYARVSTHDQTLNLQHDALQKVGCSKIFIDTASGAKAERKGLDEALDYVRKGDTLVVWRLDRLGRSLPHLIATMTALEGRGIGFKSLTENIDTTTSGGKLIFHIFGALAEFERNLIRERTQAGLTAVIVSSAVGELGKEWEIGLGACQLPLGRCQRRQVSHCPGPLHPLGQMQPIQHPSYTLVPPQGLVPDLASANPLLGAVIGPRYSQPPLATHQATPLLTEVHHQFP
jgi:hypothetical protein